MNEDGIRFGVENMQAACNGSHSASDCYHAAATLRRVLTKYPVCPPVRPMAQRYLSEAQRIMKLAGKTDRNAAANDRRTVQRLHNPPPVQYDSCFGGQLVPCSLTESGVCWQPNC